MQYTFFIVICDKKMKMLCIKNVHPMKLFRSLFSKFSNIIIEQYLKLKETGSVVFFVWVKSIKKWTYNKISYFLESSTNL